MMKTRTLHHALSALALGATLLLSACGGGIGDNTSANPPASTVGPSGPASFLLFPNPLVLDDGTQQVNSSAYGTAYYRDIDPNNQRTTLEDFKKLNGFGDTTNGAKEVTVTIGDQRDLGYGRKITGRMNADGTIAFMVQNYLVGYGAYSPISLDAAVKNEAHFYIGTNGIEFSPGPNGGVNFVKFYTFDTTGARVIAANLDGRGDKALPTICTNCHGGRGDPLTPDGHFAKLTYSESGARGDIGGQAHPLEPVAFDFSTVTGFTRASLEANIKEFNKMVLCTYPIPASETPGAFDGCRRVTHNANEYQGTAAANVKNLYGGNDMPNSTAETVATYLPGDWGSSGQTSLYNNTVANACRICHSVRGTGRQSDIDLESFTKFDGYAESIKDHVIDRGNMPLAKLVYDKYWTTPSMNGALANYLSGKGYSDASARPGRPVADPGPDRVIKASSTTLSAGLSLYANTYQWSVTSGDATLSDATSKAPTFTANGGNGSYTVQLVAGNGVTTSAAKTLTIVVDSTLSWDPQAVSFNNATAANQIRDVLQSNAAGCVGCHVSTASHTGVRPPIFYDDYDRAELGSGNGTDATNRNWFYTEVRGRVNFTDIVDSPLLRKPSGQHHGAGPTAQSGFDTTKVLGDSNRTSYDKLVAWILRGAPEN